MCALYFFSIKYHRRVSVRLFGRFILFSSVAADVRGRNTFPFRENKNNNNNNECLFHFYTGKLACNWTQIMKWAASTLNYIIRLTASYEICISIWRRPDGQQSAKCGALFVNLFGCTSNFMWLLFCSLHSTALVLFFVCIFETKYERRKRKKKQTLNCLLQMPCIVLFSCHVLSCHFVLSLFFTFHFFLSCRINSWFWLVFIVRE